ncbi:MAG TPA: hypothetical protein VHF47_13465 [Acidimicrobiales bacterium]|nr:hypothetical protein [Acidimicrobiales bacterium]
MTRYPGIHVFTARMPVGEYEALKAFAYFTRRPINDVVLTAVRSYLRQQVAEDHLNEMVEQLRATLHETFEALGER